MASATTSAATRDLPGIYRKVGSLRRERRWALWSAYLSLVVAAVIFLAPPFYMLVTSLKGSAEISDLGGNPSNDGNVIRISIPQLTEERRRDLVKQAKAKGEDARVSIRNIRRKAMEELGRIKKDGEAGEDEVSRAEKDLDKTTHTYTSQIDELVKHKEGELLEV